LNKVFTDNKLEDQFNKEGFVIIKLLKEESISSLKSFYTDNQPDNSVNFHSTHFLKDAAYKRKVNDIIIQSTKNKLNDLLINYKAIFGNFMVKEPGPQSIMPLHADWTYVDEDKHLSIAVWCPLVDTTQKNGRLGVVPKSHLLKKNFRGPKIPSPFHDHNQYIIDNYGELLNVKAGEAVIYNHKLLHFSPANLSKEKRVAFNLVLVPEKANIVHYAALDSYARIYKYANLSSDFFINYTHFEEPDKTFLVETMELNLPSFSKNYIEDVLAIKLNFWKKIKQKLNK